MSINVVVDISHHNGNVDLVQAKAAGLVGVIHKATQGTGLVDDTYQTNRQQAQTAGDIRPDLSADEVSNFIISAYFGVLRDWACDMTESDDIHLELDRRLKLIYEGLRP